MDNQPSGQLKNTLGAEKKEFLAVMSHELRTPMTEVKGYLSLIIDGDCGPVSPEIKKSVIDAYIANDHLIKMVDSIMKVAAAQDNIVSLNIQKINLVKTLAVIVNSFQVAAKDKKIVLNYEKPRGDIWVLADPDRLGEIFQNLIANAIKFTDRGSVVVKNRMERNMVVTDIIDTGKGIKPEDQGKIFELFSKTNLELSDQQKGTGSGLYLAKKLAEAQSGKIWLENSEVGRGSTFSVGFPGIK